MELFPPEEFKNEFLGDACSQLVPFSPETPIWKGRCQSDHFDFLGFPSNPALHIPVSNWVSEHVDTPSSEAGKHYIYYSIPGAAAGGVNLRSAGAKLNVLKQEPISSC